MLKHPTLDKLQALKFTGMVAALADQMAMPDIEELAFEERLGLLVDREITERENRRLTSRWRTCSALADEPDYSARLLPSVRNAVARLRDPHAAQLPVATGAPSSSGGGPWMLLPLLAAAGYFVYYKVTVPKRRAEASARVDHLSDAQARALEELRAQRDQGEHKDS